MEDNLIKLELIRDNPYQPRTTDDLEHIEKLARSIAADGLMQKPMARNHQDDGSLQLAFGHSRRKAFEWLQSNWTAQGLPNRYDGYSCMPLEIVELTDEEMYRYAVSENVQRKDLAPTEVAKSMKRYMDEFDANSKQVAELFGMNDATVRGMVRLLDLPEPVQAKLDDGTITQGTARTLLSMQKIAPEKVIVETLHKVEKRQGNEHPDETIEDVVKHELKDVVRMWEDSDRGKPQSSYRAGWPLDMKRFPNHLLPALTPVDAAVALGVPDRPEVCEILGVYLDAINNPGDYGDVEDAQAAAQFNMDKLIAIDPTLETRIGHLLNPPACTSCPFYTKIRGTHFCGLRTCHERKTMAWQAHLVEQASKKSGIEIYNKNNDGGFRVLDWQDQQLFTKKDKGLRLIQKDAIDGYTYQHFTGFDDDAVVVVATGTALEKMKSHRQAGNGGGKKSEKEKAEMRAMKIYRARRKELLWEFTGIAKSVFDGVPLEVLDRVNAWHYLDQDNRPSAEEPAKNAGDDIRLEWLSRYAILKIIAEKSSHYRREKMAKIFEDLEKFAKSWKVKIPTSLRDSVVKWDQEIAAVSVATKAKK